MKWHGYILISGLPTSISSENRELVWQELKKFGSQDERFPQLKNHIRRSLDKTELILEAGFNLDNITKPKVVTRIATLLGVPETIVDNKLNFTIFSKDKTWEDSRLACINYLKANRSKWVTPDDI